MTETSSIELNALFFRIMSNKDRLKIMTTVNSVPKTVNEICKETGFEQSWVSHSLKILKDNGLVGSKRDGKYVYYRLDNAVKPVLIAADKATPKYKNKIKGAD